MSNLRETFFSKYTLIIVGLFFVSLFLMSLVEGALTVKNSLIPALVFILPAIVWFFVFVKPTINK